MTLTEAFAAQGRGCETLGSPFMGRLMALFADRLTPDCGRIAARLFAWPGEVGASGQSLPLRLAGGLHALRLRGHSGLQSVYPPNHSSDDALWQAVSEALETEATFLDLWLDNPPQTNELRRAAVVRAVGQWVTEHYGLPLDVMELGASAGLNLNWDHYAVRVGDQTFGPTDAVLTLAPEWTGAPPPAATPRISRREGVDIAPLSPTRDGDRLLAYLWPDQADRIARMKQALTLPETTVVAADAADFLQARLAIPPTPGQCRMIYHTIAWQYFPQDTDRRARQAIEVAGARATPDTPLVWFGMEADGTTPGAGMTLRLWPEDTTLDVGRVDYHGRWVDWRLT